MTADTIEQAEAGEVGRAKPADRPHNYTGVTDVARNFRRLVLDQKKLWRRDHHRGRRPAVWEPGGFLVFDWVDVGGGLHLFCAVLAWSRWRFVAFSTNERSSTTLGFLAEA